ncbi:protein-disulfide reductase DsbD [Sphaerotilus sp.]|uniref:protein-disulfide reductase DsbD n=1 Tax=Sphaerotilus sp. TaxID=2093942 RepID=UPI0034E2A1F9
MKMTCFPGFDAWRLVWRCLVGVLVWLVVAGPARAAEVFLEPEQAFPLSARVVDARTLVLRFDVAPGYYLYRERFEVVPVGPDAMLSPPVYPAGVVKFDETFQKEVEIYHDALEVPLAVQSAPAQFMVKVTHQGCADKGLCYPPQIHQLQVRYEAGALRGVRVLAADATEGGGLSLTSVESEGGVFDRFGTVLRSGNLWGVAGVFALAGVLLSFTPCVLPMVPILSSIILGQGGAGSRRRGLLLSAAYALGMALVYTAMGVAAGLAGEGLAAALQTPWVLGAFALVLVALSLSMFGFYELQIPSSWQTRLHAASSQVEGGRYGGVFVMGGVSALIVGPCVAAPLAGALVYISQTRDVVLGGVALFAMACGMSVPLMLVGLSAGSLLPKAGAWMEWVKRGFGVMLLAVAAWMVWPVLPFGSTAKAADTASHTTPGDGVVFRRIRTLAELDDAVRTAGRPVLFDFYADWCVSCKEMERFTFTDPAVKARLGGMLLLQVDVTANNADDKALMRRYGLFGPPALLLFDAAGRELPTHRVIGFQRAGDFLSHLDAAPLRL